MINLLNDTNTYEIIEYDPTEKLEKKYNKFIDKLCLENVINNCEKRALKCDNAIAPRIYGLPKLHKEGIPLRPIVSNIGSVTYKLSKYCGEILKHLTKNSQYNIKNSYNLKELIDNTELKEEEILVSFDVTQQKQS